MARTARDRRRATTRSSAQRLQADPPESDVARLGLVLRHLDNFDMSGHDGRLIFQKSVYLLQAFGIYLGYEFSWYARGPYSSRLARHGFALQRVYDRLAIPCSFSDGATQRRLESFLLFVADKKGDPRVLEALASVHFTSRICRGLDDQEVVARVLEKQPYLGRAVCQRGLGELRSRGLV